MEDSISNRDPGDEMEIRVRRFPSRMLLFLEVAPLVRLGFLTEDEARWLVTWRYQLLLAELEKEDARERR
jgi:hypothetical protein